MKSGLRRGRPRRPRPLLVLTLLLAGLAMAQAACWGGRATEPGPSTDSGGREQPAAERGAPAPEASAASPRELFETHCSACHSLELPMSQRLDRANWEWVLTDMIEKFGATWITEGQKAVLLDYLVENYGPDDSAHEGMSTVQGARVSWGTGCAGAPTH